MKAVTLAAVTAISAHGPWLVGERSTLNPVSFVELSVQSRSISLAETAVAEREPGAAGGVAGVGVGVGVRVGVAVGCCDSPASRSLYPWPYPTDGAPVR